MNSQQGPGLAADNDFFDWPTSVDRRFFLSPEVLPMSGYRVSHQGFDEARITANYPELPRSAS